MDCWYKQETEINFMWDQKAASLADLQKAGAVVVMEGKKKVRKKNGIKKERKQNWKKNMAFLYNK